MAGTNTRGIRAVIEKAVKRAEWYEQNYCGAKDFQKRYNKQFWNVIGKFIKKYDLITEQTKDLLSRIPEQFKSGTHYLLSAEK
jgi:hypothetical protein